MRQITLRQLQLDQLILKQENDRKMVESINAQMNKVFHLNVSGVTEGFTISQATLCSRKNSKLFAMFSGQLDINLIDNKIYIDRDPTTFKHLINYLRTGKMPLLDNRNDA